MVTESAGYAQTKSIRPCMELDRLDYIGRMCDRIPPNFAFIYLYFGNNLFKYVNQKKSNGLGHLLPGIS